MKKACTSETSEEPPPTLDQTSSTWLPENTNCLACSEDGMYLCLGHSRGLSVWCASSLTRAAEWLQDGLEVNFIQTTRMLELTYLLGTVDDMGVARLFLHHSDGIHLLSVINPMEDINKRRICLTLDLSEGGHYGAASFSCNGDVWLEVYQFPSVAWLEELRMAATQTQDPNLSETVGITWSSVAVMMKIAPEIPAGITGRTVRDFLMRYSFVDVVANTSTQREKSAFSTDQGKTKRGTHHFLLPSDGFPGEAGVPAAVAVWWSGSHNLHQYSLQEAPQKKQGRPFYLFYLFKRKYNNTFLWTLYSFEAAVDPIPDVSWPNAKEIQCSAVSRCTRYIALGLDDALVCVWDRLTGAPLSVVPMPAQSSPLSTIQFFNPWPVSAQDSQIFAAEILHLLVLCNDGANYTVTTGRGTKPRTEQLAVRPKDSRELQTVTTSVPFLQGVSFAVQRNGRMFLQDVLNRVNLCFLTLPTSHQMTSPCSPVYVLSTTQQSLFIRGDLGTGLRSFSQESPQSQLFVFRLGQADMLKQHIVSQPESPQRPKTLSNATPEEICDLYLQQRALAVDERNKAIAQTWEKLRGAAGMQDKE
ncbi:WD repeat-containing protein 93 [Cololabis saira]|uniref:WD repeat-containing protein 93 n=1 Tax=Cololabis saira TaxID=129043 RepID=UPI002AD49170|nr:WD repeat-containing protein 93 [Cololabis saira]